METEYCKQGAHLSYPEGTIRRVRVGSPVCLECPCFGKCEIAKKIKN